MSADYIVVGRHFDRQDWALAWGQLYANKVKHCIRVEGCGFARDIVPLRRRR
jgi:hypothetical protein